jgi:6,7-dimethyl-8-ribityllumazine synthase
MIQVLVGLFNRDITRSLEESACAVLAAAKEPFEVLQVPGASELPIVAQRVIRARHPSVVLALACVVRGSTGRYEFVVRTATDGLARVALEESTPIVAGILACPTRALAVERGPAGTQYAQTALELKRLFTGALAIQG